MIFVDTGAWFASIVPTDPSHTVALNWWRANKEFLLTTNYIVDETLTLLRSRGETQRALILGEQFFNGTLTTVYYVSENDVRQA